MSHGGLHLMRVKLVTAKLEERCTGLTSGVAISVHDSSVNSFFLLSRKSLRINKAAINGKDAVASFGNDSVLII
jgi:hypothetical protein